MSKLIENPHITKLRIANGGTLPGLSFPGLLPIIYVDTEVKVMCVNCANRNSDHSFYPLAEHSVVEEGTVYCEANYDADCLVAVTNDEDDGDAAQ
jgi:hypothetical protein